MYRQPVYTGNENNGEFSGTVCAGLFNKLLRHKRPAGETDREKSPNNKKQRSEVDTGRDHEKNKKKQDKDIPYIIKKLKKVTRSLPQTSQSKEAFGTGEKNCETCSMTKDQYKADLQSAKLISILVEGVIEKEQNEKLDEENGVDSSSNINGKRSMKEKNSAKGGKIALDVAVYCEGDGINHNLKCVLIKLQKVIGDTMVQICFVKARKLGNEDRYKSFNVSISDLKLLKYEYTNLTDSIAPLFKKPSEKSKAESEVCVACVKEKLSLYTDKLGEILQSGRNLRVVMRNELPNKEKDQCCPRDYPHIHAEVQGNPIVLKYSMPFKVKNASPNDNASVVVDLQPSESQLTFQKSPSEQSKSPQEPERDSDQQETAQKQQDGFSNQNRTKPASELENFFFGSPKEEEDDEDRPDDYPPPPSSNYEKSQPYDAYLSEPEPQTPLESKTDLKSLKTEGSETSISPSEKDTNPKSSVKSTSAASMAKDNPDFPDPDSQSVKSGLNPTKYQIAAPVLSETSFVSRQAIKSKISGSEKSLSKNPKKEPAPAIPEESEDELSDKSSVKDQKTKPASKSSKTSFKSKLSNKSDKSSALTTSEGSESELSDKTSIKDKKTDQPPNKTPNSDQKTNKQPDNTSVKDQKNASRGSKISLKSRRSSSSDFLGPSDSDDGSLRKKIDDKKVFFEVPKNTAAYPMTTPSSYAFFPRQLTKTDHSPGLQENNTDHEKDNSKNDKGNVPVSSFTCVSVKDSILVTKERLSHSGEQPSLTKITGLQEATPQAHTAKSTRDKAKGKVDSREKDLGTQRKDVSHQNKKVEEVLKNLGKDRLLALCSPAECCKLNSDISENESSADLPLSASLYSLPLDHGDLEYIIQATGKTISYSDIMLIPEEDIPSQEFEWEKQFGNESNNQDKSRWLRAVTDSNKQNDSRVNEPTNAEENASTMKRSAGNVKSVTVKEEPKLSTIAEEGATSLSDDEKSPLPYLPSIPSLPHIEQEKKDKETLRQSRPSILKNKHLTMELRYFTVEFPNKFDKRNQFLNKSKPNSTNISSSRTELNLDKNLLPNNVDPNSTSKQFEETKNSCDSFHSCCSSESKLSLETLSGSCDSIRPTENSKLSKNVESCQKELDKSIMFTAINLCADNNNDERENNVQESTHCPKSRRTFNSLKHMNARSCKEEKYKTIKAPPTKINNSLQNSKLKNDNLSKPTEEDKDKTIITNKNYLLGCGEYKSTKNLTNLTHFKRNQLVNHRDIKTGISGICDIAVSSNILPSRNESPEEKSKLNKSYTIIQDTDDKSSKQTLEIQKYELDFFENENSKKISSLTCTNNNHYLVKRKPSLIENNNYTFVETSTSETIEKQKNLQKLSYTIIKDSEDSAAKHQDCQLSQCEHVNSRSFLKTHPMELRKQGKSSEETKYCTLKSLPLEENKSLNYNTKHIQPINYGFPNNKPFTEKKSKKLIYRNQFIECDLKYNCIINDNSKLYSFEIESNVDDSMCFINDRNNSKKLLKKELLKKSSKTLNTYFKDNVDQSLILLNRNGPKYISVKSNQSYTIVKDSLFKDELTKSKSELSNNQSNASKKSYTVISDSHLQESTRSEMRTDQICLPINGFEKTVTSSIFKTESHSFKKIFTISRQAAISKSNWLKLKLSRSIVKKYLPEQKKDEQRIPKVTEKRFKPYRDCKRKPMILPHSTTSFKRLECTVIMPKVQFPKLIPLCKHKNTTNVLTRELRSKTKDDLIYSITGLEKPDVKSSLEISKEKKDSGAHSKTEFGLEKTYISVRKPSQLVNAKEVLPTIKFHAFLQQGNQNKTDLTSTSADETSTNTIIKNSNHKASMISFEEQLVQEEIYSSLKSCPDTVIDPSLREGKVDDCFLPDKSCRPMYLFDTNGCPLTDLSGRPLRNIMGDLLVVFDKEGNPVHDFNGNPICDSFGRPLKDTEFNSIKPPCKEVLKNFTTDSGEPVILYDLEGRPLTSVSGTMLVNATGKSLIRFGCMGNPVSDSMGRPVFDSTGKQFGGKN